MRSIEEIRRRVKYIRHLVGSTYCTEIDFPKWTGRVIFGFDKNGWEHVSVSPYNGKIPTWDDMCAIKDIFWEEEEAVIQILPKKSEYVNMVENCLHLWRNKNVELPK